MAYANDVYAEQQQYAAKQQYPPGNLIQEEPPLVERLERLLGTLNRSLSIADNLTNGPRPETGQASPLVAGVMQLGMECEKASMAIENQLMILAKRIGRL